LLIYTYSAFVDVHNKL